MPNRIKAATLFSGIGAPECAMSHWDWRWCAEIEKFPSAVLSARHPSSVNLGDVNAEDFVSRSESLGGRPDVLVFGSPCQDFSIAGRRVGLDGDRGNLALVALGIVNRLRPRWVVFENVPGLLSSRSGSAEAERSVREGPVGGRADSDEDSDFAAFLSLVQQCGYLGCYRITDAQYAGVPQRRRRIFAVFCLGDWRPAAAVLFEPEGLRGDNPPSREAREGIAPTISSRPAGSGGLGTDVDINGGLIARPLSTARGAASAHREDMETYVVDGPTGAVSSKWSKGSGGPAGDECYNLVPAPPRSVYAFPQRTRGDDGRGYDREPAFRQDSTPTIDTVKPPAIIAFDTTQITHPENRSQPDDRSPQLSQSGHPPAIAFDCKAGGDTSFSIGDVPGALRGDGHGGGHAAIAFPILEPGRRISSGTAVRRLTPRECERLQAFPDSYTDIIYRGKPAADGPRYKALGNAMNVREIQWVLSRIEKFETEVGRGKVE